MRFDVLFARPPLLTSCGVGELSLMSGLESITLYQNSLTGTIPPLSALANLSNFLANDNQLTGCFEEPRSSASFSRCKVGGAGNSVCVCNQRYCENDTAIFCGRCSGATCPAAAGAPPMAIIPIKFFPRPMYEICPAPAPATPPGAAPVFASPVVAPVAAPVNPPLSPPVPPVKAPMAPSQPVSSPVSPPLIVPVAPAASSPVSSPVTTPVSVPVSQPVSPPVSAPVSPPRAIPVSPPGGSPTPPKPAPVSAPVVSPAPPPAVPLAPVKAPVENPAPPPAAVALSSAESGAILDLARAIPGLQRLPAPWSIASSTGACSWTGIQCSAGSVISVNLAGNCLEGSIPASFLNLTKLTTVSFMNSRLLTGKIPEIGLLRELVAARFDGNKFSGPLPSLGDFPQIRQLEFSNNNLSGPLPAAAMMKMKKLEYFGANFNGIQGSIPDFFSNLAALKEFSVIANALSGTIPGSLSTASQLLLFRVSQNHLSGTIPGV